ncbi:chorismate mutase [Caulobacter ginsengisoli]|uniref:chorismate mutase n=1 Tax=Caulobacter ginsengisoli TaxID=400775 RepID=A0ABU0IV62_9CAUL|nr:chorismate mutase [Caulobacter ginsengisoli]MDQ0465903.1 chorismate mutase [Caulobacter ginsengisoli]
MGRDTPTGAPSLDAVRARIDIVDSELLKLLDERAGLAAAVAAAKKAAGGDGKFGLRSAREAQVLRHLLAQPRESATPALIVRIWREIIGDSLSRQGPFHLAVWGGKQETRAVELARLRFGIAPPMAIVEKPEQALAAAKTPGGVAVLSLGGGHAWWGRLLAQPSLRVFATLPCLSSWGPTSAMAVAEVKVEPSGRDQTLWVTDSNLPNAKIVEALSRDGVAGEPLAESGGLKLFALAGFYQTDDARLARAPGTLSGVIGAAPEPFDL